MSSRNIRPAPAAGFSPQAQAHVAFMRFGLGPKMASAARLAAASGAAYDACLREIANPGALLIPDEQVIFNQALINLRPGAAQKPDAVLNSTVRFSISSIAIGVSFSSGAGRARHADHRPSG